MTAAVFTLQGEYIELKALLKLTDLVSSGGEAKMLISEGQVLVDGEIEMRKACSRLFSRVDAVLSPTNPIISYPVDWASPTNDPARPFEHIGFTVPWNMSEQPAASINCGFSRNGMPIGLQIVGPRFGDLLVLKLSHAFEQWTGGVANWPEPPAPGAD